MRLAFALVAVIAASATAAQAAEDRYGPARAAPLRLASNGLSDGPPGAYQGRMLHWSSRPFVPQEPQASTRAPQRPAIVRAEPSAPAAVDAPRQVAHAPVRAPPIGDPRSPIASAPVPPRARAEAPAQPRTASPAPALPDSLYAPPPPAAAPQRVAQAAAPAAPASGGSRVHLYSVHRQYGLTPDAIPAAAASGSNYVLIEAAQGVGDHGKSAGADDDRPF